MYNRFKISLGIFLPIILILTSCVKPEYLDDANLAEELHSKSSDTITTDSHSYFLESFLTRNLMPGGPIPNESKLVGLIYLVNSDSLQISSNISPSKLYVINGTKIWASNPVDANLEAVPDYKLDLKSINGPEWSVGLKVDVILEIFSQSNKTSYYIINKDKIITGLY